MEKAKGIFMRENLKKNEDALNSEGFLMHY